MDWTESDFWAAGLLLALPVITGLVVLRRSGSWAYRAGALATMVTAMVLIWMTGAVGLIGASQNDANLMFAGVLATGTAGAFIARLQATGLAHTLVAMAGVQTVIGLAALALGLGQEGAAWPADIIAATAFFTGAWLTAAALFRLAGRQARARQARTGA